MTASTFPPSRKSALPALLYAAFIASPLAAAPPAAPYQGISLGLGGEANTITLSDGDYGLGALFTVEGRLGRFFALDFHGTATTLRSRLPDFGTDDTFLNLDALLYLRFYLFAPKEMRQGGIEFFLGVGGGVLATLNGLDLHNSRGSPEAGGIAGFRFRLGSRFYLEPYIRASYHPRLFGAGLTAGFRFPARPPPVTVIEVEKIVDSDLPNKVFTLVFPPSSPSFDRLDEYAASQNRETMLHIRSLLDQYPSARLLIEGYANPVLGTDNEKPTLLTLSGRRAAYIAGILVNSGISPERLVYVGEGGSRPIVPIEDRGNWNQNRRVEIRLIHDIPQAPSASSTETADEHR